MLDIKRLTPLIAIVGAIALTTSAPAFAQTAATSAAPAASSASPAADSAAAPAASHGIGSGIGGVRAARRTEAERAAHAKIE